MNDEHKEPGVRTEWVFRGEGMAAPEFKEMLRGMIGWTFTFQSNEIAVRRFIFSEPTGKLSLFGLLGIWRIEIETDISGAPIGTKRVNLTKEVRKESPGLFEPDAHVLTLQLQERSAV